MQLPKSEQLNIASLSRLFDNKAECYKLFWFQAILDMFAIMQYMLNKEFNKTKGVTFTDQKVLYGINKLKEYKQRDEIAKTELHNSRFVRKGYSHGYNM